MQFSSSQPDFAAGGWEAMLLIGQSEGQVSFSQPTKPEHMLLGSQLLGTPGASQVIHQCCINLQLLVYNFYNFSATKAQGLFNRAAILFLSCFSVQSTLMFDEILS